MKGAPVKKTARLLLVDDNRDNLEILTVILGERYAVAGCGSAGEALEILQTFRPDVVVLDIRMTPVDGLQCLAEIRARPGYSDIPAIALTALARDVEKRRFLAGGFQAVVTKPILDHREVEAVIEALLSSAASSVSPGDTRNDGWSPVAAVGRDVLTRCETDGMMSARGRGES
jgi:CheY-like chemotaxis protein